MDVTEERAPLQYREIVKRLITLFQYKKYPVELKGSQRLASQQYYSDIDLYSLVKPDTDFIPFLKKLITQITDSSDLYFIELKLQTEKGKKTRVYPGDNVPDVSLSGMEMAKVDVIVWTDGHFEEASIIYSFAEGMTPDEYQKSILDDIKELKKERKYYKILKREFNLYKMDGNKQKMVELSKIFNSELGRKYQLISRLEAIQTVLEYYQTETVVKRAVVALKNAHVPIDVKDIDEWVAKESTVLNKKAKAVSP